MAKKTHHRRSTSRAIVRVPTVRPVVIKQTKVVKHKSKGRRHHSAGLGGFLSSHQINSAIGGAALGFIQKNFPNLPKIPLLGEAGTVAVAAYFLRGKVPFAQDVCTAALVVAGYQLAHDGAIQGVEGGYVAGF